MKKIIIAVSVAAMMLFSANAFAQWSVGGGYVHSQFSGKDNNYDKILPGFYFGATYDWAFSPLEGLSFEPGVSFSHFGRSVNFGIGDKSYHLNYLSLPLNIKYAYEFAPDFKVSAFTGPRFNLGVGGNGFKKISEGGMGIKLFDAQWGLGVAATYADAVRLSLGYDFGLNKEIRDSEAKVRRNALSFGVAFLF